jgi:outer membrane protein assembly factor BamB
VYFVSLDNVLRALDRNNGAQRWKRGLPLRPIAGPLRAADTLLVSGLSSPLAFQHRDGAPAGNLQVSGELAAQPYVVPGAALPTVVVVTRDIAAGASVTAFSRSIEPTVLPMAPLPNPVAVTVTP